MIDPRFVLLGAAIAFAGGLSYLVGTLKGSIQPHRITWFMWSLAPLVAFAAEMQQGVGLPAVMTFMVGFNPLLILAASFANRTSAWQATRFDLICGGLSLAGLVLWYLTRAGDLAIVFAILADALAAVPTMRKAYINPDSESYIGFLAFALNAAITLLTIKVWNFATYAFPLYILVVCLLLTALIALRPVRLFGRSYA